MTVLPCGQLYRLHDREPRGAIPVRDANEARAWNTPDRGHGIFEAVNLFAGPRRIEHLKQIRAWTCDIDEGSKREQHERIQNSPLVPTRVTQTRRGFQLWFAAKDATRERYELVENRLVAFFRGDPNAKDLSRILRRAGFLHLKVPSTPFLVTEDWAWPCSYSEEQMLAAFPPTAEELREQREAERRARATAETRPASETKASATAPRSFDFWPRVWAIDAQEGLRRLSGHSAVRGEVYSFRPITSGKCSGNVAVFVDGKPTSVWIDRRGRIGSLSRGGPGLDRWLMWFGHSRAQVAETLRAIFPELSQC